MLKYREISKSLFQDPKLLGKLVNSSEIKTGMDDYDKFGFLLCVTQETVRLIQESPSDFDDVIEVFGKIITVFEEPHITYSIDSLKSNLKKQIYNHTFSNAKTYDRIGKIIMANSNSKNAHFAAKYVNLPPKPKKQKYLDKQHELI